MNRYYVVGTTCAGKDYLMDYLEAKYPDVGSVRVGKIMRDRYPPGYFQGSGAPKHTEVEALQIFEEELAKNTNKRNVFISGQPRRIDQIEHTVEKYPGHIIWLWASDDVILERIDKRFANDLASKELALQRIKNDKLQMYDVMFKLMASNCTPISAYDTGLWSVDEVVEDLESVF